MPSLSFTLARTLLVFDTERDSLASQHLDDDLHFTTQAIHALMRVKLIMVWISCSLAH